MKQDSGLITIPVHGKFEATVDRVCASIAAEGYHVFARIDHAANASGVGQALAPTVLVLFGNPEIGTALIADSRTAGIDLPSKILVWQDDPGSIWLTYNAASWIGQRHGLGSEGMAAANILAEATARICDLASREDLAPNP